MENATPAPEVTAIGGQGEGIAPADKAEAVVRSEEGSEESQESSSFFGEVAPSESELMGSEESSEEAKEKAEEEKKAEEKKPEGKGEEEKKDEKAEDDKQKLQPPPKGFVPLQALHAERNKRQVLETEIIRLKRENEALSQIPAVESLGVVPEDFKVLSDAEEDELMQEDIVAYQKYRRDLKKFDDLQKTAAAVDAAEQGIIESSFAAMESVVPGLFEEDSKANKALTAYASAHGLPPQILSVLTDPKTKVLIPGQPRPVLMGKASVELVKFLKNSYFHLNEASMKAKGVDKETVKKEVEAELKEALTKEITAEVMKKFKDNKSTYRGIDQAPGSGEIPKGSKFSEDDFAKMTEEQQRTALGG